MRKDSPCRSGFPAVSSREWSRWKIEPCRRRWSPSTTRTSWSISTVLRRAILAVVPVTGLNAGDDIFGIDFRPRTGELFALGFTRAPIAPNTLTTYVIDPHTGKAEAVGSFEPFFYFGQTGPTDFDPVKDRLLYIYNIPDPGQFFTPGDALLINPNTGAADGRLPNPGPPNDAVMRLRRGK